jgi:hypothetical protein
MGTAKDGRPHTTHCADGISSTCTATTSGASYSRKMSTYQSIRSLAKELLEEKAVKKRRAAAEKLENLLANPSIRRKLASEVTPPAHKRGRVSIHVAQRKALAEVWRYLIHNAVVASQQIVGKQKSKVTKDDVILPWKMLRLCSKVEEDFGSPPNLPTLSKNEAKLLIRYCLEMLENEDTLRVAELVMLEMLDHICSRREFVAYFKPQSEIRLILQEVEIRINSPPDDLSVARAASLKASEIFKNLMHTASDLGMGMHLILPGCVKMVAEWCATHSAVDISAAANKPELPFLLSGVACLLRSEPEQSVAPLTRHGRPFMRLAMRCYRAFPKSEKQGPLTEYFTSHL